MRLNKKTIDKIVAKLKAMIDRVQPRAGSRVRARAHHRHRQAELKKMMREAKDDPEAFAALARKLNIDVPSSR